MNDSPINGWLGDSRQVFERIAPSRLLWYDNPGVGYLPVSGSPYDEAYFRKYVEYADTPMGRALNNARIAFVGRWYDGEVVDIGIGCGQFVERRSRVRPTYGYDINPAGVRWLRERKLYRDPVLTESRCATFWDSLEHIGNPQAILGNVLEWVFVALPIFDDLAHVLRSKHYRPDEHCWYFTEAGFIWFMQQHWWEVVEVNRDETRIGREDIVSFAFKRKGIRA